MHKTVNQLHGTIKEFLKSLDAGGNPFGCRPGCGWNAHGVISSDVKLSDSRWCSNRPRLERRAFDWKHVALRQRPAETVMLYRPCAANSIKLTNSGPTQEVLQHQKFPGTGRLFLRPA